MEEFLRFIIGHLVEFPDEVIISRSGDEANVTFHVAMRKTDIARVIGKGGHTIQALRSLLAASAHKQGANAHLEIIE